jgi:hypothetical protein
MSSRKPPPLPPQPTPHRASLRPQRPSLFARLTSEPVATPELDRRARAVARPVLRITLILVPVALLITAAFLVADMVAQIPEPIAPHHRAEALCFELERPDPRTHRRFEPPMRIEPSAALLEGHFGPGESAPLALREMMRLDESMVLGESQHTVGDYRVSVLWLDLPPGAGDSADSGRHWLVLAWMEGADLAVCNFRFAGTSRETSAEEREWADHLLARLLVPENFQAGELPHVRLWARHGRAVLEPLGPSPRS